MKREIEREAEKAGITGFKAKDLCLAKGIGFDIFLDEHEREVQGLFLDSQEPRRVLMLTDYITRFHRSLHAPSATMRRNQGEELSRVPASVRPKAMKSSQGMPKMSDLPKLLQEAKEAKDAAEAKKALVEVQVKEEQPLHRKAPCQSMVRATRPVR